LTTCLEQYGENGNRILGDLHQLGSGVMLRAVLRQLNNTHDAASHTVTRQINVCGRLQRTRRCSRCSKTHQRTDLLELQDVSYSVGLRLNAYKIVEFAALSADCGKNGETSWGDFLFR